MVHRWEAGAKICNGFHIVSGQEVALTRSYDYTDVWVFLLISWFHVVEDRQEPLHYGILSGVQTRKLISINDIRNDQSYCMSVHIFWHRGSERCPYNELDYDRWRRWRQDHEDATAIKETLFILRRWLHDKERVITVSSSTFRSYSITSSLYSHCEWGCISRYLLRHITLRFWYAS